MVVEHWHDERFGPFSEAALRRRMEERGYFVSRYVYPPGTCFPDHTHELDKLDGVVSGRFRLTTLIQKTVSRIPSTRPGLEDERSGPIGAPHM